MVNAENINKVIAAIRDEDNFFNMVDFKVTIHLKNVLRFCDTNSITAKCGTPACIAGWANHLGGHSLSDMNSAAAFLGISRDDNDSICTLFAPHHIPLEDITREEAIATLERLRDTGQVVW